MTNTLNKESTDFMIFTLFNNKSFAMNLFKPFHVVTDILRIKFRKVRLLGLAIKKKLQRFLGPRLKLNPV